MTNIIFTAAAGGGVAPKYKETSPMAVTEIISDQRWKILLTDPLEPEQWLLL